MSWVEFGSRIKYCIMKLASNDRKGMRNKNVLYLVRTLTMHKDASTISESYCCDSIFGQFPYLDISR